ncbi:MAG: NusG domain II-containing protein [Agathobacter sp.]|nr:NusG domain II-containing protein [Agathobacter sp.]
MRRRFGKADAIFIGALAVLCLLVFLLFFLPWRDASGWVVVTRDGEVIGRYRLDGDQTVEITDVSGKVSNVLVIADGRADMTEADCPDKLCVHQRAIRRAGENLVCLPNRVVVTVEGGKEDELDGIAQ